ncbi:VOC family protein [Leptolyngbya sp. CCNP1308]|uniref:VOC family protein n=1 Tax=Leptolyngbya sp. CCNP1308 TaxID=3110255 RepID=UPI002B212B42|nr:VOC family protein [Leptolyngbya sp. CCNP1308]MEA5449556.1 VOC family protein [Leptolyngbya sp. CCNP1308]
MKLWFGIITEKLEASKAFYRRLFDCEVIYDSDWFVLLRSGQSELGFMLPNLEAQAPIFRPAFGGKGAWITIDVDDAQAEYQRIAALGVSIEVELRDEPWGDRHFVVIDPNGIGVDIVQHQLPQASAPEGAELTLNR